ncbi:exonuclease domain-containing protein [Marinicella sp. S1101]|uniref:exonuclease domain-containing protein n=1 Tax=Marinicella marina TaxID=2996016 RepID=UPI0022609C43|nr:exonuclease domain-containing protein [Marinicella marina]MCX7554917.1 exonuclease domain-containing protein [Marinicella marina]MDJ1141259.1 exonuclease domain-containing protein [Marinicella marina]
MFWNNKNQKLIDRALRLNPMGQLKNYLMTPLVDLNLPALSVDYLVLDFETTGLDDQRDHIISIGFTEISQGRVQLNRSQHHLVKTEKKLESDNVSIHQITDDEVSQGIGIKAMMNLLLQHMAGKAVVAHYQSIEYNFIQRISEQLYGHALPMVMVDTLQIERRKLQRLFRPIGANQLRLFNLRNDYNLPRYHAHNAMEDAIATAELLLAQICHRQQQHKAVKLKDITS